MDVKMQNAKEETRELPLVSCIMPTNNRRTFVPKAIEFFLRQDYPNRQLIIIDDGSDHYTFNPSLIRAREVNKIFPLP
jgi:hypothetical protein